MNEIACPWCGRGISDTHCGEQHARLHAEAALAPHLHAYAVGAVTEKERLAVAAHVDPTDFQLLRYEMHQAVEGIPFTAPECFVDYTRHGAEAITSLLAEIRRLVAERDALSAQLDAVRERAEQEITDAEAGAAYAGEVNQGVLLASEEARSFAWKTVDRLAAAPASKPEPDEPTCEHGQTRTHRWAQYTRRGQDIVPNISDCPGPVSGVPVDDKAQR